jgi:hypothetical protein
MILFHLSAAVYVLIACFALYMTAQENSRRARSNTLLSLAGYALCLVWPVMVLTIFVAMAVSGPQTAKRANSV